MGPVAGTGAGKMDYACIVRYGVIELVLGGDCDVKGEVLHHGSRCDHGKMSSWARGGRRRGCRCWLHFQGADVDAPIIDPGITALIRGWRWSKVRVPCADGRAAG